MVGIAISLFYFEIRAATARERWDYNLRQFMIERLLARAALILIIFVISVL
jgi:hypothetical protein